MARVNLDAIPGVRSVRRIRQTIHSEIAENKFRLDHLGQDTAVLLEALRAIRSELSALAFEVESTKRRGGADTGEDSLAIRLERLEDAIRDLGERVVGEVESHDRQSFSRLAAIRRELVSLEQTWDWSEHRPPDGVWIVDALTTYLAPLLHAGTAIEVAPPGVSSAPALRERGLDVIAVEAAAKIDALRSERGWGEELGLVRLATVTDPDELLNGFGPTRCEVLVADLAGDAAGLEPLLPLTTSLGLRRWITLLRRENAVTFSVNSVSLPPSTESTVVFVRDRDTFMAATDWCSRNVAREPQPR